jgi:hypothetical protein
MREVDVIYSIEEYLNLANSDNAEDNKRTVYEELSLGVISDVINKYPDRKPWLVHNKHIPVEVLIMLSTDDSADVRFTVAMKKKCDRSVFEILMKDADFSVRMAVVRNSKFPMDLLEIMKGDSEIEISEEATRILKERLKNKRERGVI